MAKKAEKDKNDAEIKFRCRKADVRAFKRAAEEEGFSGNLSAWILYHLRRQASRPPKSRGEGEK